MSKPNQKISLALSGGGSRAIAFHLGCLRVLHRRGILDRVQVISSVSGGSVISAMYAYTDDSFEKFDARVVALLKKGLQWDIVKMCFQLGHLPKSLATFLFSGVPALIINGLNLGIALLNFLLKLLKLKARIPGIPWMPRRYHSRTNAFEAVLNKRLFQRAKLPDVKRREDLDVVINATDLTTSNAFRFGNRLTFCSRHGEVIKNKNLGVATAVAASAAFPPLLPALDMVYDFHSIRHGDSRKRVILTDGGVYDNLGITCLEPGRDSAYTRVSYDTSFLIVCDAGHGMRPDTARPYWWPARMGAAFGTVFKKSIDYKKKVLHLWAETGRCQFIYAFLGQQDQKLETKPSDCVTQDQVNRYPTDFGAMSDQDLDLLIRRGEQQMEILIGLYGNTLTKDHP
jgi:NTE family protein